MTEPVRLPQSFGVQYLGRRVTDQLWGIRSTRGPVDALVAAARRAGGRPPPLRLTVSPGGVSLAGGAPGPAAGRFPIERISYGVQDVVHARVFAMIVVCGRGAGRPFECHAFACDGRESARRLTEALAAAFGEHSRRARLGVPPGKFAVDLRSAEEIEAELTGRPGAADSEA